ncbi:MAG: hypothetical protein NVSMB47_01310 [Polyangiales bacterium]
MKTRAAALAAILLCGCSGSGSADAPVDDAGDDATRDVGGEGSGDARADTSTDAVRDGAGEVSGDAVADAGPPRAPLLFGVVEEQHAICFKGETYPCGRVTDDDVRRKAIAAAAPGLTVRYGGYETERSGLGFTGNAQRRNLLDDVGFGPAFADQLEPAWLLERGKAAGYAAFILAVPVTRSAPGAFSTGAHEWDDVDARQNLDAWSKALGAAGAPPPAFIELGNEPWNYPASNGSDGYKANADGYVTKARLVGRAVRAKILELGWPTRIAVVVDNWPGGDFESGGADKFPKATIDLAAELAVNGPPVLQTHAYPLHGGYWCPKPIVTEPAASADHSDLACVWALHTMLGKIKALAPDADLILTEDNFDASAYPRAGVYTTLAALLTYASGGVAYTHFGNNDYKHEGAPYELFVGTTPVPLLTHDLALLQGLVAGLHAGDVRFTSSGSIKIAAGGYTTLVGSSDAPAVYDFTVGSKTVHVDVNAVKVTVGP